MLPEEHQQLEHLRRAAGLSALAIDEFVLPTSHQALVGDIRLHFLDWPASPAALDILLLHGGALTAHTWDLVCVALQPRYRCVALDLRGHGDSEWPANMDYSRSAYLGDLEGFADLLGLDRYVLVGMSLGGLNAIEYASRHSERLAALVIVDITPEPRPSGSSRTRDFIAQEAEFGSIDEIVTRALEFNPRRDAELLRTSLLYNLRTLPNGKMTWKYDRRLQVPVNRDELPRVNGDLLRRLPDIQCPTLVIRGGNSEVLSLDAAERLSEQIPDARLVTVPDAGHTVQGDNPRGLLEALDDFFREIGYEGLSS